MRSDSRTMTTAATHNPTDVATFWRVARRLYPIYIELDRTFELGAASCPDLEQSSDRPDPTAVERVRDWFQLVDTQVQVWQLRQLLQSTNLQSEESLRYLIARHLEKGHKTEADKEKIDFLLVQYFAHCSPEGVTEQSLTLPAVARVLKPALGEEPSTFPDWTAQLDQKLHKMNNCDSLEDLQESGGLMEAREMKMGSGAQYFEPALLVAFTRFNFLARRAFFRAMHLDLHAIRAAVNELEKMGYSVLDCRDAGLSENESLDQLRHVVHQWKGPFRAPYSGGSSFQPVIQLRQSLQGTLEKLRGGHAKPAARQDNVAAPAPSAMPAVEEAEAATAVPAHSPATAADSERVAQEEEYLQRCVLDITEQLASVPPKHTLSVSTIDLGGCKLMIATWEAEAFKAETVSARALQKAVSARTILHVCMDRYKRNEPTDLEAAVEIAKRQAEEMKDQVTLAKEASNIDAAVNLAATAKRLLALVDEAHRLSSAKVGS
jgi:hypothetical protein